MANPEHLERLLEASTTSIDTWNEWRASHPDVVPDLTNADLRRTDLMGANLNRAYLNRAYLNRAYLRRADLGGADLRDAILRETILREAILMGANLNGAVLNGADLSRACLHAADLSAADLSRASLAVADLGSAHIGNTVFADVDLSAVQGLETMFHISPSSIGIDSIYRSNGQIPEVFLRGCGVPEHFITYMRSLVITPIDYYSCFISYSHTDKAFARRLHDQLQAQGIRCWLDEHQLLPGDDPHEQIDRGIRLWDKVLLCASKASLTSWWVDNEVRTAFDKEQKLMKQRGKKVLALVPLNLDGYLFEDACQNPTVTQIRTRMAADFTGWEHDNTIFEHEFERLVRALRADVGARDLPPDPKL